MHQQLCDAQKNNAELLIENSESNEKCEMERAVLCGNFLSA